MEKATLRAQLLGARAGLAAERRAEAGRLIRDALLSLPQLEMAGTVAAYYSVGAEPDTRSLVFALWKRGTYVLLPRLKDDGDLDWASYEGPDSLVPGPRGLLEPGEAPRGADAVARADVVLVPALAVDGQGNRLGRGGGSFDRALARVGPLIPVIALLYDDEFVDRVPAEPHDVPVRAVARPGHGVTWLPPQLRAPLAALGPAGPMNPFRSQFAHTCDSTAFYWGRFELWEKIGDHAGIPEQAEFAACRARSAYAGRDVRHAGSRARPAGSRAWRGGPSRAGTH